MVKALWHISSRHPYLNARNGINWASLIINWPTIFHACVIHLHSFCKQKIIDQVSSSPCAPCLNCRSESTPECESLWLVARLQAEFCSHSWKHRQGDYTRMPAKNKRDKVRMDWGGGGTGSKERLPASMFRGKKNEKAAVPYDML